MSADHEPGTRLSCLLALLNLILQQPYCLRIILTALPKGLKCPSASYETQVWCTKFHQCLSQKMKKYGPCHIALWESQNERHGHLNLPGHGTFRALSEVLREVATRDVATNAGDWCGNCGRRHDPQPFMEMSALHLSASFSYCPSHGKVMLLEFSLWSSWLGLRGDNSVVCISVKHSVLNSSELSFKFCFFIH